MPDALPILRSAIERWISSNVVGYKYMPFKVRSDWNSSTDIADMDLETQDVLENLTWFGWSHIASGPGQRASLIRLY